MRYDPSTVQNQSLDLFMRYDPSTVQNKALDLFMRYDPSTVQNKALDLFTDPIIPPIRLSLSNRCLSVVLLLRTSTLFWLTLSVHNPLSGRFYNPSNSGVDCRIFNVRETMLTGDLALLSHPKGLCTKFVCGKVSRKLNRIFNVSETMFTGGLGLLSHPKDFCTKFVCGKVSRRFNRIFNVRKTVLVGGGGGDLGLLSHTKDLLQSLHRICLRESLQEIRQSLARNDNNNNVHLSGAHQRSERSHDTY